MIHAFLHLARPARLRACVAAALAVVVGTSCGSDPVSPDTVSNAPAAAPTAGGGAGATIGAVAPIAANAVLYTGIPFGPFGLWTTATSVEWGPKPFTGSHNFSSAGNIVTQIATARSMGQRLILAMTGGASKGYLTNGKFDLAKWKSKMNSFNTTAIKNAIAAGVADGTIIGNTLMDEPETKQWGGVMTKPLLDQMAIYARGIFPTLKMGVNHGPPAYKWRSTERYKSVDYVLYQYAHYVTSGNVTAWRDAVLAQAKLEGVTPAFSLNVMNGGVQDRTGTYDCVGTGGKGTFFPNCRMTPDQIRTYGRALAVGCALAMWRFDEVFMSKSVNIQAFQDVAAATNAKPRQVCKRI